MAREADVSTLYSQLITIKAGGGSAMLMGATAGQVGWLLKYASGGSLEIHGCPTLPIGVSTGSALPSGSSGYLLATTEPFSIAGPSRFFLVATGTDAIAYVLRAMGPGF